MAVILIVDDEVFIREATALMIEDLGHGTLSASDVDGALSILRAPQHIDALITDIRLITNRRADANAGAVTPRAVDDVPARTPSQS